MQVNSIKSKLSNCGKPGTNGATVRDIINDDHDGVDGDDYYVDDDDEGNDGDDKDDDNENYVDNIIK